jgi:hypothetical protein
VLRAEERGEAHPRRAVEDVGGVDEGPRHRGRVADEPDGAAGEDPEARGGEDVEAGDDAAPAALSAS